MFCLVSSIQAGKEMILFLTIKFKKNVESGHALVEKYVTIPKETKKGNNETVLLKVISVSACKIT